MRPTYPNQPNRDYKDPYDQSGHHQQPQRGGGKRPNKPQQYGWQGGQGYNPEEGDVYQGHPPQHHQPYDTHANREGERYHQQRAGAHPRDHDNYYYQQDTGHQQQEWAAHEYQDEIGHYQTHHTSSRQGQQSQQQYHPQDYYYKGGRGGHHGGPGGKQPKSFKKSGNYQQPQGKRYPDSGQDIHERGFGGTQQYPSSEKFGHQPEHYGEEREVNQPHSRGGQDRKFPMNVPKSLTIDDRPIESGKKASTPAHRQQALSSSSAQQAGAVQSSELKASSGTGAKHAYGEYYTQQQYIELQTRRRRQAQQQEGQPTQGTFTVASGGTIPSPNQPSRRLDSQTATLGDDETRSRPTGGLGMKPIVPIENQDERFARTMAKYNTLDRGTYFVNENNKQAHFFMSGRSDLLGWYDTFVINGYFLHGVILKLTTLTSRIFLFVENLHPIYKKFIKVNEDDKTARWSEEMPDKQQIVTVTCIEKVEVLDNDEEGFEGFVCYTICEDSKLEIKSVPEESEDWKYVQDLILLYEPTSIRKIYIDMVFNSIYKPESKGFGGKRIAAIVNPNLPGQTIQYSKAPQTVLDKTCIVGAIWIQNGRYTLIAETLGDIERLIQLVDMALDVAEELGAYVMITNLRRTFDLVGKTILYINSDPTLKLIRSSNPITFAMKVKKSENLV